MMKHVTLKYQRFIMFIPFANWFIFFIAYYNLFKFPDLTIWKLVKGIIIAISIMFAVTIMCEKCLDIPTLEYIIQIYVLPIMIDEVFIVVQKMGGVT